MTEPTEVIDSNEPVQEDRLTLLKKRADMLGISYSNNIGADTLAAKIEAALAEPEKPAVTAASDEKQERIAKQQRREAIRAETQKLVRIRITCMNPAKKDWPGEIITHGSKFETTRKFVPFTGHENGYHVPYCIYEILKERKFAKARTVKKPNGIETTTWVQVNEFNIEVLPQLTPEELAQLAKVQAAAAGM